MKRVVCLGNPLVAEDAVGPQIYSRLLQERLPEDVELVDGGTLGLDLLPCFEGTEKVILVDRIDGFLAEPGVILLRDDDLLRATELHYDHHAGIGYLLRLLPAVCDGPLPEVCMIGVEGCLNATHLQKCLEILQQQLVD